MKQIINVDIIAGFMFKNRMKEKEFCDFCKIPYPLISRMIFNDYDFNFMFLLQIAEKIGVDLKQLFIWFPKRANLFFACFFLWKKCYIKPLFVAQTSRKEKQNEGWN